MSRRVKKPLPTLDAVLAVLRDQLPELRERHRVRSLGVFGSYVRGEQGPRSDVDLLVEFEDPAPGLFEIAGIERALSEALGVRVDLVLKSGLKPRIGRRILDEVITIGSEADAPARPRLPAMSRERLFGDYLQDMLDAIADVETFTAGQTFAEFTADRRTIFAVLQALQILGEAARRIPPEVRARYPEIPWREMSGLQDRLIHGYRTVDLATGWRVAQEQAPALKGPLRRMFEEATTDED